MIAKSAEGGLSMLVDTIKSNKTLHPLARAIKKYTLRSWISLYQKIERPKYRKNIRRFKDIHKGQRCFIVATGPSLTLDDLAVIKDEYSFSVNSIVNLYDKTDYRPTYYMVQDGNVERRLRQKLEVCSHKASFMGVGDLDGFKAVITKRQARPYRKKFEFYNLNVAYHMFDMCYADVSQMEIKFSSDCASGIYDGCTVTYSAIQMACYMGFEEIYLLGCDTNFAGHVDEKTTSNDKICDPQYAFIKAYERAKHYADERKIKIYNATRGGMLEVFPRVDFDELFCR